MKKCITLLSALICSAAFAVTIQVPSPSGYESKESYMKDYMAEVHRVVPATMPGAARVRKQYELLAAKTWREYDEKRKKELAEFQAASKKLDAEEKARKAELMKGLPLKSFCGIEFGAEMPVDESKRVQPGSNTFRFEPEKKFRDFEVYEYSVNPKINRVYGVRVRKMCKTQNEIRLAYSEAFNAISNKYQKTPNELRVGTMEFLFGGSDGELERKIIVSYGTDGVAVVAVDLKLKAKTSL